ncbi:uncharacterized protein LOC122541720 [Chiloscyllium plagiosum]|uniref:uncharacterized protein LOC122541720 n=1 Tax=Chiloscyllium plagiosum TaxID=36176 RepID=UPI001CB81DFE|nr:uncharacterized protein LOC122541720 [Chiloscyllium plagiosum]
MGQGKVSKNTRRRLRSDKKSPVMTMALLAVSGPSTDSWLLLRWRQVWIPRGVCVLCRLMGLAVESRLGPVRDQAALAVAALTCWARNRLMAMVESRLGQSSIWRDPSKTHHGEGIGGGEMVLKDGRLSIQQQRHNEGDLYLTTTPVAHGGARNNKNCKVNTFFMLLLFCLYILCFGLFICDLRWRQRVELANQFRASELILNCSSAYNVGNVPANLHKDICWPRHNSTMLTKALGELANKV